MGQVFRAHDPRLGRAVAIKVSREEFTSRFQREARAIAALNHPHVCTLYDIGPGYLAMAFIEGETLADRLARGRLGVERALLFGAQIAGALAAAHARGIVHRDLKPGNIMLGKSGVKVLDFGLAASTGGTSLQDATRTMAGTAVGTPAYMAPEQLQGGPADARADVYALGLLLHEMATGVRPPATCGVALPARFAEVVQRCLNVDPDERWQSARDLQTQLEWMLRDMQDPDVPRTRDSRIAWRWVLGAAATLAVLAAAALLFRRASPIEQPVTFSSILPPEGSRIERIAVLSPDGRSLVFTASAGNDPPQLWIRSLDAPEPVPLPGTTNGWHPFWSPDSRWVAFYAQGVLKKIDTRGGAPVPLYTIPGGGGTGGTWSPQGQIIFSAGFFSPLLKIPAAGGSPSVAAETDVAGSAFPWFLPDGEHFLFVSWPGSGRATLRVGSLRSTDSRTLMEVDSNVIYASGHLLYMRGDSLVAQPFDADALRTTGEAVLVAEPVRRLQGGLISAGMFSASRTGLLAFQSGAATPDLQLTWFDREGNAVGQLGDAKRFWDVRFSPDGRNLLASVPDEVGNFDLWKFDMIRGLAGRFTTDDVGEYYGVWSADGRTVYFNSTRGGHYDLYRTPAAGGAGELLHADDMEKVPTSVSKDGRNLLYFTGGSRFKLWRLPLLPDQGGAPLRPVPMSGTTFNAAWAQFSPDDEWIAYQSDESGQSEVYVARFAEPARGYRISASGGTLPRWRADGKAIFFADRSGMLQEAQLRITEDGVDVTGVNRVFSRVRIGHGYPYDVVADASRALVAIDVAAPSSGEPLTLVENWTAIRR